MSAYTYTRTQFAIDCLEAYNTRNFSTPLTKLKEKVHACTKAYITARYIEAGKSDPFAAPWLGRRPNRTNWWMTRELVWLKKDDLAIWSKAHPIAATLYVISTLYFTIYHPIFFTVTFLIGGTTFGLYHLLDNAP